MPSLVKDSTDNSIDIFIPDSSATDGSGLTGLDYDSAGLTIYYRRGRAGAATSITPADLGADPTAAHADGGFAEIDATNKPGWYRLDLPDALAATGVDAVSLSIVGATNAAPVNVRIYLVDQITVDSSGRVRSQDEPYFRGTFAGTPTATAAETATAAIQAYPNDYFNTTWELMICDGPAKGQRRIVTDFVTGSGGGTGFTYGAINASYLPVSGNAFILSQIAAT